VDAMSVTENEILTPAEVSELVGDDVAYWMQNPFMDRDALTAKVCWWITLATKAGANR
jgi:hypothetical protein